MVIAYLDIVRIDVLETEADAPLIVTGDRVLAFAITFQPSRGRDTNCSATAECRTRGLAAPFAHLQPLIKLIHLSLVFLSHLRGTVQLGLIAAREPQNQRASRVSLTDTESISKKISRTHLN
jgi:hypothetical protein